MYILYVKALKNIENMHKKYSIRITCLLFVRITEVMVKKAVCIWKE